MLTGKNKKGTLEKHHINIQELTTMSPEFEDQKPDIMTHGRNNLAPVATVGTLNEHVYLDTSDSVPKLHTDSSCSEHVVTPDITCEREVQSEPKMMRQWDKAALDFQFNYLDASMDFGPQPTPFQCNYQMSPLQDMFMYLHKPF